MGSVPDASSDRFREQRPTHGVLETGALFGGASIADATVAAIGVFLRAEERTAP